MPADFQDGFGIMPVDVDALYKAHSSRDGVTTGLGATVTGVDLTVTIGTGQCRNGGIMRDFTSTTAIDFTGDPDSSNPKKVLIVVNSSGTIVKRLGTAVAANPPTNVRRSTFHPDPPILTSGDLVLHEVWLDTSTTAILAADVSDRQVVSSRAIKTEELAVTDNIIEALIAADTFNRFSLGSDGEMAWGPGNAALDTILRRGSAGDVLELLGGDDFSLLGGDIIMAASQLVDGVDVSTHASRHNSGGSDVMAIDAAAATGSLRTLGSGALQAKAGNAAPLSHATSHEPGGGDIMAVDAVAGTGSLRTLGSGAQQAKAGNATPLAHATTHEPSGSDIMAVDAATGTGSLRTIGATALQAAAGDHTHAPGSATVEEFWPAFPSGGATRSQNQLWDGVLIDASGEDAIMGGHVPDNFNSLTEAVVLIIPGATDTTWDADIFTRIATNGENRTTHTDFDTTSTYNITTDILFEIDVSGQLTALLAGDYFTVSIEQKETTAVIVHGLRIKYET